MTFSILMSDDERTLERVGEILSGVARPHPSDEALPLDVRAGLWRVGVVCGELTSRQELVARLWARKRALLTAIQPRWDGPSLTPPGAA